MMPEELQLEDMCRYRQGPAYIEPNPMEWLWIGAYCIHIEECKAHGRGDERRVRDAALIYWAEGRWGEDRSQELYQFAKNQFHYGTIAVGDMEELALPS